MIAPREVARFFCPLTEVRSRLAVDCARAAVRIFPSALLYLPELGTLFSVRLGPSGSLAVTGATPCAEGSLN